MTVKEKPKIAKRDDGVSCADFCKNMQEGAVLLLGSSMARGVGKCLADQNLMYSTLDFSGARIENIRDKVKVIGDRPESHVMIMVGTNNLKYDDAETMLAKYRELIDELNARKYRKLSIVGILQRFDFGKFIDDKRRFVNKKLKEMCEEKKVEFVEVAVGERLVSKKDRLHLNYFGQQKVAIAIDNHCTGSSSLN